MSIHASHIACIIGGAVAGSEAAACLAERGIYSVVVDMCPLPWGKIELGLPKWHSKQRDQEEARINERLSSPYVHYVPSTKLGSDIELSELLEWGFSAVLLAVGAWRDRPLSIPGIDDFQGSGFYYQNPYVAWFNQYHSPDYDGPEMEVRDGAVVIGGGLASLDVVKILMMETTVRALKKRGIKADLFELEKKGIPKVLRRHNLEWEDLNLKGCTLYYRRRVQDMPLMPMEDNPSPEKQAQAEKVREKLMNNFLAKYLFRFEPQCLPVDKIVRDDRVTGMVFRKTRVEEGRVSELPNTEFQVHSPLFISSIGSIPEAIPGLSMHRELFEIEDSETGKVKGFSNVFALGNAVTGRGNIRASRIHGRQVSKWVIAHFLKCGEEDFKSLPRGESVKLTKSPGGVAMKSPEEIRIILDRVSQLQKKAGFDGDYASWVTKNAPVRLEDLDQ